MHSTTLIGGFDQYGSAACPCCFGPATPYSGGASACTGVHVRDVLIPIVHLNQTAASAFGNNGLIRTNWGAFAAGCESTAFGCAFVQDPSLGPVAVDRLVFERWLVVDNGWNAINQPIVNWAMNTSPAASAGGRLTYVLASSRAVVFAEVVSLVPASLPILRYDWGVGNASAIVEGTELVRLAGTDEFVGGSIRAQGIAAPAPASLCAAESSPFFVGVRPTNATGAGAEGLRSFAARGCAAYAHEGGVNVDWRPETIERACGYRLSPERGATGALVGDYACPGGEGACGLRVALFVETYSALYSRDVAIWENAP